MIYRFNMNIWPISTCFATKVSIFCKDEAKKSLREAKTNTKKGISSTSLLINKNFKNKKLAGKEASNKKRVSIRRTILCKASPVYNFGNIKSINLKTNPSERALNLVFRRKKRILTCFAFEGQSVPWKPENNSKIKELGGPSIWIVKKVQSLTEKLIQSDKSKQPKNFSSKLNNRDAIILNRQSNQRFESKLYAFGLASHYQLQKNINKIEVGLRQGCQLFTVYVFGSFCWLYLIKYSSQTNELFKVDFLFQDTLFETLPLLSEKGIIYAGSSEADLKAQSIDLFPKKEFGVNCAVIDGLPDQPKDHAKHYALDTSRPCFLETSSMPSRKGSAILVDNRQTFYETINYRDKKNGSNLSTYEKTKSVGIELTPLFSEKLQNYIGKKNTSEEKSQVTLQNYSKNVKEGLVPSIGKKNTPKSSKPLENLIFFARKPLFLEDWSSSEYLSKHCSRSKVSPAYLSFTSVSKKKTNINMTSEGGLDLACLTLEKQTLTQKKAYNLSGTSMIIDPEIDLLPRKLEECVNFSKIYFSSSRPNTLLELELTNNINKLAKQGIDQGERYGNMLNKLVGLKTKPRLVQQEIGKHIKVEERCSVNFKPYFTLTKSLLWCKPLIKTKRLFHFGKKTSTNWLIGHKTLLGIGKKPKQTVKKQEELLLVSSNLSLKTKNFKNKVKTNSNKKISTRLLNVPLFLDIFLEPRLQSGFQFPNEPIFLKNNEKLKGGLGITINPQLLFSPEIKAKKNQNKENKSLTKNESKNQNKEKQYTLNINGTQNKRRSGQEIIFSLDKRKKSKESFGAIENKEYFFDTNIFLEWLYEPNLKSEYLFYSRPNNKLLKKKTSSSSFIVLDKHTDLKTSSSSCFLEQNLTSQKTKQPFVEEVFSYKRNSFTGLLNAPENFFGTPYLKLGERFTIEKLKSKNKMGTLYSIHDGAEKKSHLLESSEKKSKNKAVFFTKPYASMGVSLKTVFGKKQFTTPQNQTSKKKTVQNLITNARLVTSWSKDLATQNPSNYLVNFSSIPKENNLIFSSQEENTSNFKKLTTEKNHLESRSVNSLNDYNLLATESNSISSNVMLNKAKILKILENPIKRISGKANRNIALPFKYYNPGIKRERNLEDTLLILEGYKKSRLFPTIHTDFRGIATRGLPITIPLDKSSFSNQDYELQSILLGMRQRTETQRIAENLSQPSKTNLKGSLESQEKEEYELNNNNNKSYQQKSIKQNKSQRILSNYYPLLSSLAVRPQEAFPLKVLGATNTNLLNKTKNENKKAFLSISKTNQTYLKGSYQTKGFYFEKLFSQDETNPKVNNVINRKQKNKTNGNFLKKSQNKHGFLNWVFIIPFRSLSFGGKILFFTATWYSYKLLATPLSQSTHFLPATFTEAIGLQSFQQKYRIIKGEKRLSFSFKNIAGAEKTLSELRDLIWTFRLIGTQSANNKYNLFTLFPYIGSRIGRSRNSVFSKSRNRLLLAGPPGTGKTLLVKALAAEANLPVIVQPVSSLRMISGVENPVSALFHVARQIKPCIIFLDELDTLGNESNVSPNNYTAEQKLGLKLARKYTYTLLLELDGLTSSTRDLLIIGATNRLETLNSALTRAGRFDTILDFNLPSQEVRTSLFSFYLGTTLFQHNKKAKETKKQFLDHGWPLVLTNKGAQSKSLKAMKEAWSFTPTPGHDKNTNLDLSRENQNKNKSKENYFKEIKAKDIRKEITKLNDNFLLKDFEKIWIESYLAEKCFGLSHASIGTIINESALEAMLNQGKYLDKPLLSPSTQRKQIKHSIDNNVFKPLHTLETLERAINSVKTLTRKQSTANTGFTPSMQESNNILSLNSSFVPNNLRVLSMCHDFAFLNKNKINKNQSKLYKEFLDFEGYDTEHAKDDQQSTLIKPFITEFLVNRVYQTVGSLILLKKQKRQDILNSIKKKANKKDKEVGLRKSTAYKPTRLFSHREGKGKLTIKTKKPFFLSSLRSLAINKKYRPINKKDYKNLLLQEYSGYASLAIYTALKPLTFKIGASTGLYQDPSYVSATLSTLKILTLQNSVFTESILSPHLSGQVNEFNQNTNNISQNLAFEDKTLFSGFVKESSLPKSFFSNSSDKNPQSNIDPSSLEHILNNQEQLVSKTSLFWKNRKSLNKSLRANNAFNKHSKGVRTHIMDVKNHPLTTNWFRIYFSRPFFRYDTFHYIENKEYYPKNNYILKRNKRQLFLRNVSTLSHTTILCNSLVGFSLTNFFSRKQRKLDCTDFRSLLVKKQITGKFFSKETTEKKGKFWSKENSFYSSLLTSPMYPELGQQTGPSPAKDFFTRKLKLNCFSETKESLYLALVASIFQKGIQFFQKNRELTDCCAYTFLRYGVLYEFYLEAILKKFKL